MERSWIKNIVLFLLIGIVAVFVSFIMRSFNIDGQSQNTIRIVSESNIQKYTGDPIDYVVKTEPSNIDRFNIDKNLLPHGLVFDEKAGKFSGAINVAGNFTINLTAEKNGSVSPVFPLLLSVKAREVSPSIILRLHGSNTIGANLAPELVTAFLKDKGYTDIEKVPVAEQEILIKGKKVGSGEFEAVEIKSHGSATAFDETDKNKQVGLFSGYADIGMSSTSVKTDMVTKFKNKGLGDLESRAQEHVIGLDCVAVIVHSNNQIDQLTTEQLKNIFLGKVTNWSEVGGNNNGIKLYSRDKQSGTYDTFKHKVLSGNDLNCDDQLNLKCFEDSKVLVTHVASDPDGIGFVGFKFSDNNIVKVMNVSQGDGLIALGPNRHSIRSEDYAISRRLYLYQTSQPSPISFEFVQFALSNKGQELVHNEGFVEVGVNVPCSDCNGENDLDKSRKLNDPSIPDAYKNLIRNADRHDTPMNFRFRSGESELDTLALPDIGRLAEKLESLKLKSAKLILIGFSDSDGDDLQNLKLSESRSKRVKDILEQQISGDTEIEIISTGFGEEVSLLLNRDNARKADNRRVEVWLQNK